MSKLLLTLIIGVIAGAIDIVPMLFQKMDKYSVISAFIQWVAVTFVITHIQFGLEGWLKGLIIAVIMALPIIVLVMKTDTKAFVPILAMSLILGSLVGFAAEKLIK